MKNIISDLTKTKSKYKQLALNIPAEQNLSAQIRRYINRIRNYEFDQYQTSFIGSQAVIFAFISNILINLGLVMYGLLNLNNLPANIRFFYNYSNGEIITVNTLHALLSPLILLLLQIILLRVLYNVFKFDRRLSLVLCWLLMLINIITLVAGLQIFELSM